MTTAVTEIADLLKGIPAGAWVAISEKQHKAIAYGADAQVVLNEAREKGEPVPLIVRVPETNSAMFL